MPHMVPGPTHAQCPPPSPPPPTRVEHPSKGRAHADTSSPASAARVRARSWGRCIMTRTTLINHKEHSHGPPDLLCPAHSSPRSPSPRPSRPPGSAFRTSRSRGATLWRCPDAVRGLAARSVSALNAVPRPGCPLGIYPLTSRGTPRLPPRPDNHG